METHLLNVNVPEDQMTECIFRIEDYSNYSSVLPITNPQLVIQLPGNLACVTFGSATTPAIAPGFALNLNACMFGIQTENCGLKQYPLPDGIYLIDYSVAPNDLLSFTQHIFRTVSAKLRLKGLYAKLNLGPCEPTGELKARFDALDRIDRFLKVAKIKAEIEGDCAGAMRLYEYAVALMEKVDCKTC